jgi:diguanylate cyclase (GGDEF)-like protein
VQSKHASSNGSGDGGGIAPQLVALNGIARIATQDLALRPMLQRIVDALHDHFGWEFIACASIRRNEGRFVCEALYSAWPTEVRVDYGRELGSGIVGTVARDGQTIEVEDACELANFVDTLSGTRSELCVPVKHQGEVLAVLNLESRRANAFLGQRVLLETVAEQIASAIVSARLRNEIHRRAELFEMMSELSRTALEVSSFEQTLERITAFVRERFSLELCSIFLANADGRLTLRTGAGQPRGTNLRQGKWPGERGITLRAFRTGQTQFVPDVALDPDYLPAIPGVKSELAIPIRLQGRLLGVINMESASPDSFVAENRQMLESLASQVAGAIHLAGSARQLADVNRLLEERSLELQSTNAQLRHANAALEALAHRDGLTGVANRRRFDNLLQQSWQQSTRERQPLALLLIDIDRFKAYNDSCGHVAGDDCLQHVASALAGALGANGAEVARYGGEEFAVLLTGCSALKAAKQAERLRAAVMDLRIPHCEASPPLVTISIGVAAMHASECDITPDVLIRMADEALYQAKREGRNRVVVAADIDPQKWGLSGVA